MKKIDTSDWKDFRIGSLFERIVKPPVVHSREVTPSDDGIPYVVRSKFNNGVKCLVVKEPHMKPSPGGTISFGAENATFFYQPTEFVSGRDIYYIDTTHLTERICLFLVSCLRRVAEKYTYNYGLFPDLLKEETIKLPVCTDGSPDWIGMEKFVEKIDAVALKRMHSLQQPAIPRKIDCEHWKPFPIGNLFEIVKGTRLTKANMLPGDTNFIGASYENNGVTMHISNKGHIHPAGTITVSYNGAHTGVAFYQDEEFWASDDINVLYPKFPINKDIAMFLLPIIKKTGAKYGFIDKWEKEVMAQDELMLPSKDGKPDWEYMEKYIKFIRYKTAKIVAYAESLNITKEENE